MADDVVGACCLAVTGAFQQFFNTKQWGMDCKCCDQCCRCDCCWDAGEFNPDDRPGASQQQESGPKDTSATQRHLQPGEEDLPAYKPNEGMSIPAAPSIQAAPSTAT